MCVALKNNHNFGNILLIFNNVAFNKITRVANMEQLGQTNQELITVDRPICHTNIAHVLQALLGKGKIYSGKALEIVKGTLLLKLELKVTLQNLNHEVTKLD